MKPAEYSEKSIASLLPERPARSNKGTYGKILCAAGSYGMSGAAYLSAKAAYRTGAGLVRILTPEENRVILQSTLPEAVLSVYDAEAPDAFFLRQNAEWADVLVIGPGLGRSEGAKAVLVGLLQSFGKTSNRPVILDADALNLIAEEPSLWTLIPPKTIITPHPGEMSRLCGRTIPEILSDIPGTCRRFAKEHDVICVLKDHETAVADSRAGSAEEVYINHTGNSGMAPAGVGDVLTGMIASLCAQGMPAWAAAVLGVRLHGMAGDRAASILGEYSVMASDIVDSIPYVMR